MTTSSGGTQTLERAITLALADGHDETAAAMLRRAFGRAAAAGRDDLPELLEEFAEYFVSVGREEEAIAAGSTALLMTPADGEDEDVLRRRCRIAQILLTAGLPDEACAVYAAVAEEVPGELWVHEAAGCDYVDAGEYELAYGWLTAGLEHAVAKGDDERCVARLLGLRRISMRGLGLPTDDLDAAAVALVAAPSEHSADADDVLLLDELDRDRVPPQRSIELLEALRLALGSRR